jgi:hypothetical protein
VTSRRERPEELLREMRAPVVPVASPEDAAALRERTVAHLRGLQARAAVRREMRGSWRVRALVAAVVLLSSGALAMSRIPWARALIGLARTTEPPPASAQPAEVPRTRAKAVPAAPTPVATSGGLAAPPVNSAELPAVEPAAAPAARSTPSPGRARSPAERSTLSEENRLMQAALAAARGGDDARAIELLTALLTRYPESPLAQNAKVERFRALARSGAAQPAAKEAREYLSEHPNGMASDEARSLTAPAGGSGRSNARLP